MEQQPQAPNGVTSGWIEPEEGEQAAYDKVMMAVGEILYGEEAGPQVAKMLKAGAAQPEQTIAQVAVTLMVELDEQSGNTIPEGIMFKPLEEIIEQLGGIGHAMGLYQVNDDMLNRAAQIALEDLGAQYDIDEAEMQAFFESIDPSERDAMAAAQRGHLGLQQAGPESGATGQPGAEQPGNVSSPPPNEGPGGQPAGLIQSRMAG